MLAAILQERIGFAVHEVVRHGAQKLAGSARPCCVVTFGFSETVASILANARAQGSAVTAVVADAGPHWQGKRMVRRLLESGVGCTYLHLNALAGHLSQHLSQQGSSPPTHALVEASAVLPNGSALALAGSAATVLAAKGANVPVLLCCESLSFSERVQLDSITWNELGERQHTVPWGLEDATVIS